MLILVVNVFPCSTFFFVTKRNCFIMEILVKHVAAILDFEI